MRLKYYLRGLGIGIAVTAVLMSATAKGKGNMTDAQIIARARELGMVDGVLTEVSGPEDQSQGIDETAEKSVLPEKETTLPDGAEADGGAVETPQTKNLPEGTDSQEDPDMPAWDTGMTDGQTGPETLSTVIVSIYPGEGSFAVSRKLAALGLVESADIYDGFLCQNGYDKKLCTGNYEIQEGATAEEIARIITRSQ